MKHFFTFFLLVTLNFLNAQTTIEWSKSEEITLASFKANVPNLAEDNVQQYIFAVSYDFSFQMQSMQFTFTKNFNKYVNAYYNPNLSWMEDGELTDQLLLMANLDFDLVELYARKFRKRLFETKNIGSNVNFFDEIHKQIYSEYTSRVSVIQSNIRSQDDTILYLETEIKQVNFEIDELSEFCKTCKPKKKR